MVKVPEYWIVKKGRQWLMTTRHEDLSSPKAHIWSINTYDAAKYEQIRDAKRMAWEVGGVVYRFIPATSRVEQVTFPLPEGACCDQCETYVPFDGKCRNPESEYYGECVSCFEGLCCEWREKHGRKGQTDSKVDPGCGPLERPGAGSGRESLL